MRHWRRFALQLVVAGGLLSVPVALADKPARFPLPAAPMRLSADICGFPIDFVPLQNKEFGKVFSNGVFAVNGVFKAQYTNVDTGKTITLNISGGGRQVLQPDGTFLISGHGPAAVFFLPDQIGPGAPGVFLFIHGQFRELIDQNGVPIPGTFSTTGNVEDICALLS